MKWLPPSLLGVAAALLALAWSRLPDRWVVHWGLGGRPDGWATKTPIHVFGPLLIGVATWLVFELIGRAARTKAPHASSSVSLALRLVATSVALVIGGAAVWLPLARPTSPLPFVVFTVVVTGAALAAAAAISARDAKRAVASAVSDDGWRGLFYRNANDPRLWVPKRFGFGWTLNFAHRRAWLMLLALLAPAIVATIVAATAR